MTVVDYRCVCGETISLDTGLGGQCSACGRTYAADILHNAPAETVSVRDMASCNQVARLLDDRDDPCLGQTFGHYEILRPLGHGGMGSVYQALDTSLQRYVALKVIRTATPSISETPQLQRLFQEAIGERASTILTSYTFTSSAGKGSRLSWRWSWWVKGTSLSG